MTGLENDSAYARFAGDVQATGVLWDPWFDGAPRLQQEPLVLQASAWRELAAAAEAIAAVHDELAQLVAADADLLDAFFAPTTAQRAMWCTAAPRWHGIARADVFATPAGLRVCELNSDTPSGQPEAVALSAMALAADASRARACVDPNAGLGARTVAMIAASARRTGARGRLTVGIVYPTEFAEDLAMIALVQRWLEDAGHDVVLGSPFNVARAGDGRATVFGTPCDVVVRHYKTDWWGERLPVRDDDELPPDRAPLVQPLHALLAADLDGRTAVVNPFGAVITQNKRALALCWEAIQRFSPRSQQAIRALLPRTLRLEVAREHIWQQRAQWVLKSDHGCEGAEVIVGAAVGQDEWEDALAHAIAQRWVAQEYFAAAPAGDGLITNHGVYVVAGRAAGVFARRHAPVGPHGNGVTDAAAHCVPVMVEREAAP
jgi:glutathionylspermidine synthase